MCGELLAGGGWLGGWKEEKRVVCRKTGSGWQTLVGGRGMASSVEGAVTAGCMDGWRVGDTLCGQVAC